MYQSVLRFSNHIICEGKTGFHSEAWVQKFDIDKTSYASIIIIEKFPVFISQLYFFVRLSELEIFDWTIRSQLYKSINNIINTEGQWISFKQVDHLISDTPTKSVCI